MPCLMHAWVGNDGLCACSNGGRHLGIRQAGLAACDYTGKPNVCVEGGSCMSVLLPLQIMTFCENLKTLTDDMSFRLSLAAGALVDAKNDLSAAANLCTELS